MARMYSVGHFMDQVNKRHSHYSDGLISKGEFVRLCMDDLHTLMNNDLKEAQRVIDSYGITMNDFSTWAENTKEV
ncbi:MAG: hypothetical protein DRO67_00005 [Candidatus Asgardarchaeum californiense]|nr:MAG: hypothetical protein DRO67_00005 [Candidatus Asgardarchaeum californiense]